jgi:hypothetical protein
MDAEEAQTRYGSDVERLNAAFVLLAVAVMSRGRDSLENDAAFERAKSLLRQMDDEGWGLSDLLVIAGTIVTVVRDLWKEHGEEFEGHQTR